MKVYGQYPKRSFYATLLAGAITLAAAYPSVSGNDAPFGWFVCAVLVGIIPWLAVPSLWVVAAGVILSATPIGGPLFNYVGPTGLSGNQVAGCIGILTILLCTHRAYPIYGDIWSRKENPPDTDFGSDLFLWGPVVGILVACGALAAGANVPFAFIVVGLVQTWHMTYAVMLDRRPTHTAIQSTSDPCSAA